MKQCWPAPERNKGPILEVLELVLPKAGTVLEIASGSGQHIAHFAPHFPALRFIPSDIDPDNLASIEAWAADAGPNVLPPRVIDVRSHDWAVGCVEAIFCANMIHIAPWACTVGLIEGVSRNLHDEGVFVLYGPFRFGGEHVSPSNVEFDASLRERNPDWGVRDVEEVAQLARDAGLLLKQSLVMPANNHCLVFRR